MSQREPTLPALHTLAMLSLRDADSLLNFAERLYDGQSSVEARWALRRIDRYRVVLGLPRSIGAIQRSMTKSHRRGAILTRNRTQTNGTARHRLVEHDSRSMQQLAC